MMFVFELKRLMTREVAGLRGAAPAERVRSTTDSMLAARFDTRPYYVAEDDSRHTEAEVAESARSENDILYQLALFKPRTDIIPAGASPRSRPNTVLARLRLVLMEEEAVPAPAEARWGLVRTAQAWLDSYTAEGDRADYEAAVPVLRRIVGVFG